MMKRASVYAAAVAAVLLLVLASPGEAQADGNGIGAGVETMIGGPFGATVVYDPGTFRISGLLALQDNGGGTDMFLAARGVFVLHEGDRSDFGIGAALGLAVLDDADDDIYLDIGPQIRYFLTGNVAAVANFGLALIIRDGDDTIAITGDLTGVLGLHYYFR